MKKKLLCCALLAGIGMSQAATAQSYDDRWYLSAGAGVAFLDRDRNAADEVYGTIGLGKMVSPHWSIDAEIWHSNPDLNTPGVLGTFLDTEVVERNWELLSLSIVGRYHFIREGRDWHPYIAIGLGAQEHHDGTQRQPLAWGFNQSRTGVDVVALAGVGFQKDLGYAYLRGEMGVRVDTDDASEEDNSFVDGYLGVSFLFPLGPEAAPPAPEPEPVPVPQKTCADLDDDGDGVNNCDDKCPASPAGQAVGPDGCPVPEPVMEPKPFRG